MTSGRKGLYLRGFSEFDVDMDLDDRTAFCPDRRMAYGKGAR